ncbi:MAG: BolA family transcriptional regulator [Thioploca sp.]|nr:BolA family transcriptional regulator [Thioploca sp.]
MPNTNHTQLIKEKLQTAFTITYLEVTDESHKHVGHPGTQAGGGHFVVTIVSPQFSNQSLIQRHRLVYAAVDELMNTVIHALSIQAQTPEEFSKLNK